MEGLARLELSVRGILRDFGLKPGRVSKGRREERVREPAADNAMLSDVVAPILRLRAEMRNEPAAMTKRVRTLARADDACRLLTAMPGAGPATAFVAAAAGPSRFRRARDVGARAGTAPTRGRSGERDVSGGITRAGDAAPRTAPFQAATAMPRHGGKGNWLKSRALRAAGRRGRKCATAAPARRMGVALLRTWRDGTEFRFARAPAAAPGPAWAWPHRNCSP